MSLDGEGRMYLGNGSDQATLEYSFSYNPPMDLTSAENNLKEVKQVLDQLGVVFFLYSGTCLGATRDKAFIPWDDDIDLLSVIGMNGLTEEIVEAAAAIFRERGYFIREIDGAHTSTRSMMKNYVRVGWDAAHIIDGAIYAYPGVRLPIELFEQPKEIEFLGEKFLVPNPPEDYLSLKYGAEWMVPKKSGLYEMDVVEKIPDSGLTGQPSSLRVLDHDGVPVPDAEVVLVGNGRSRTDENGYAELILPGTDWYAIVIRYPGHEQVLYMEEMEPNKTYVYRAGAADVSGNDSGEVGTPGNVLTHE
jgi:hypothetical protein